MTSTNERIMDNREVAAELAKLPESVQLEIVGMIKGAQLISEARLVSNAQKMG